MSVRIKDSSAQRAFQTLQRSGPRGRALANLLDERNTRVRVWNKIPGGITLNFLNLIILHPLPTHASDAQYKAWVTLLAHEACHVEQKFWIDSVQQEMRAYATQAIVGDELGIELAHIKHIFANLNSENKEHQQHAQAALQKLFPRTPAARVYAALPLKQPSGMRAIFPALRQIIALVRAGRVRQNT